MKVIRPVTITDAMLYASSVPEPDTGDPSAWNSGTIYALDQTCYRASTHRKYRSLQNANLNHTPETSPTWWTDIGGTNRWAMFDPYVSTQTIESAAGVDLDVTVNPGIVDALYLYGLVGDEADVVMRDSHRVIDHRTGSGCTSRRAGARSPVDRQGAPRDCAEKPE